MGTKFILPCLLSLICLSSCTDKSFSINKMEKGKITSTIKVTSPEYGPYEVLAPDSDIVFSYKTTKDISGYVAMGFGIGVEEDKYYDGQMEAKHTIKTNTVYLVTFVLKTSEYLLENGMYCRLYLKSITNDEILFESKFRINPILPQNINGNKYIAKSNYSISYLTFRFADSIPIPGSDVFYFDNLKNYFDVDNYYRLDLRNNPFSFKSLSRKTCDEVYLTFDDKKNLFPYFNVYDKEGFTKVPLKLIIENTDAFFQMRGSFYVNETTLEMSSMYKEGFVLTNQFFFPINHLKDINTYTFNIHLKGIGISHSNVTYSLSYDVSNHYVGDCSTSDYCVIGGAK